MLVHNIVKISVGKEIEQSDLVYYFSLLFF